MPTDPHARFITACVREPTAELPYPHEAMAVRDWQQVVALATEHRVAAFVHQAALRADLALPPPATTALERAVRSATLQVMVLDADLARVAAALAGAGLPVLALKGPVLARTLYPAAALRPYGDLDLVVQARHERAAIAVLAGCGFAEVPYEAEVARRAHGAHGHAEAAYHRLFRSHRGGTMVELHLDPLQLGLRPARERDRWARAVPVPQLPGALMLAPADQLVQLSVHAHKHGFDRLIWLKDLDLLVRTHGDRLDWELVQEVAGAEGVRASVWYALWLTQTLLRTPLSDRALASVAPAIPLRVLYRAIWPPAQVAALRGPMRRRAVQFHAAERWRGVVPSLVLMGRRRTRLRAAVSTMARS